MNNGTEKKLKENKKILLNILDRRRDKIILAAAAWVHTRSIDLKGDKPGEMTLKFSAELFLSYQEAIIFNNYKKFDEFIRRVVDYRVKTGFHMSTLVMGFLSFKKALEPILKKEVNDLAWQFKMTSLIDSVYEVALFKVSDLYQLMMSKSLESQVEERSKDLEGVINYIDAVINSVPYPLFIFDKKVDLIYINQAFINIFGWRKEELVGNSVEEFHAKVLPPEVRSVMTAIAKKRVVTGETVRSREVVVLNKKGERLPGLYSATGIKDALGHVIGNVKVLIIITELKKAQEALVVAEKEKRAMIEKTSKELEQKVRQRTKEIHEKVKELEKFYKLSVGRELKMVEIKEENKKLKNLKNTKVELS